MNVKDITIKKGMKVNELAEQFSTTGFQASEFSRAVEVMDAMRSDKQCLRIFAFTANMVASGLRGVFAQYIREGNVDAVITTGGSIDHDLIRAYAPYEMGSFAADDIALHKKGINRIGNILVPNARYELLEKKVQPVFKKMHEKQHIITPSSLVTELTAGIKDKNSIMKACLERHVPIYSPNILDSALGLQLYFFKQDHAGFVLDELKDMRTLGNSIITAKRTGAVILGGGTAKHFTIASNILRGGLDYAAYFTTAQEYDGSLSGARVQEAKSWGKVGEKARSACVYGDATITFPLAVASLEI
ncbi:putative deoxyhypusine synthase [Candidatus Norongarragalina meridionalis]|nr:putative deoxyhypusine synthase [Candidatus Norongarragalina meridionalis]